MIGNVEREIRDSKWRNLKFYFPENGNSSGLKDTVNRKFDDSAKHFIVRGIRSFPSG